jgi:hypothetical protein
MRHVPHFVRPTFDQSVAAWKAALAQRGFPAELVWIFDENLCFEPDPNANGKFKLGFQIRFTPPPPQAEEIAYDHFSAFDVPVVFYRIGSWRGRSLCLLLCDEWFDAKGEREGYLRRDEWLMAFWPGGPEEIEEITDVDRWQRRILRNRPLHDLDFCMTLRGVHEILAHGRVLSTYERYALKFLTAWKRLLNQND